MNKRDVFSALDMPSFGIPRFVSEACQSMIGLSGKKRQGDVIMAEILDILANEIA